MRSPRAITRTGVPSQVAVTAFFSTSPVVHAVDRAQQIDAQRRAARDRRPRSPRGSASPRRRWAGLRIARAPGPRAAGSRRPLQEDIEILRRARLGVKGERVPADDDVLNPFAGELLQQLFEVGRKVHGRDPEGASARPTYRRRRPGAPPGVIASQKSVEAASISSWLRPPLRSTFDGALRRGCGARTRM